MADKNRNGIDDKYENSRYKNPDIVKSSKSPFFGPLQDMARQGYNFLDDISFLPSLAVPKNANPEFRAGDYLFGVPKSRMAPKAAPWLREKAGPPLPPLVDKEPPPVGNTQLPSFMSFLQDAMGQSGVDSVSFDPQRNNARQRGTEYDARLAAMYEQLQNSMRNDGAATQQNYQGAIDDTAQRAAAVQQQIQAASNAADDRNAQVLANLGIEEAQGNIVQGGRDLNTQTADAVADAAARGQISGDALQQNQQSAGAQNAGLVGAAGLEGNLQRARVQSELASLLAQYDMQEQEANRQAQQQSFTQAMGLANAQYEDAWRQRGYEDDMSKWLFEQQQAATQPSRPDPMQMSMNFIGQLQQQYPDLDMEQLVKLLGPAASIGKLYR